MEEKKAIELRQKEEEKRDRVEILKLQLRKWKEDDSKKKMKDVQEVNRRRASSADPGTRLSAYHLSGETL